MAYLFLSFIFPVHEIYFFKFMFYPCLIFYHSLTHSLTHLLTHSLLHPPTLLVVHFFSFRYKNFVKGSVNIFQLWKGSMGNIAGVLIPGIFSVLDEKRNIGNMNLV
jgi:hypothetical protein